MKAPTISSIPKTLKNSISIYIPSLQWIYKSLFDFPINLSVGEIFMLPHFPDPTFLPPVQLPPGPTYPPGRFRHMSPR